MAGQLHQDLIGLASKWLANQGRCFLVVTDLVTVAGETPDAIGWNSYGSILVECKASRSDFRADKQKFPRRIKDGKTAKAIGSERYYFAPQGIIPRDELLPGWGLLEVSGSGKIRCVEKSERHECDHLHESRFLLSLIRRMGPEHPKGAFCKFYAIENNTLATVGILPVDQTMGAA